MLEIRNLTKTYKPKKGVPVVALDNISLKFPDRGMIFLLGKSGSGKSTLLNLLGGLDIYDSGEIIIKGKSSKNFKQQDFDSYRNTYVGFIFQEYNVLDEFTVGANIALALELQGKKATDEKINSILKEVDLEGFGQRKPNELSGGQKQRVAIARALVKNPKIISADEPTGALDSNTGRQIFDTLKKLSADKLVIVVSHDRDFAENYADRIIELADGKVISDLVYLNNYDEEKSASKELIFSENIISIPENYHLTEEDRLAINEYIDKYKNGEINLSVSYGKNGRRKGTVVDNEKITNKDNDPFKLIKSKLPIKNAFKIGASGLKYKKIRLIITILLSGISFSLFGLSDTLGSFNYIDAGTNSIVDSEISYAALSKEKKNYYNDNNDFYYSIGDFHLNNEDIDKIQKDTGIEMSGVYIPENYSMSFISQYDSENIEYTQTSYNIYAMYFNGFAEITSDFLEKSGYTLIAGNLPNGSEKEIAISKYVCESFIKGGYKDIGSDQENYDKISTYEDMIGKALYLGDEKFIVTGVIDMKFNFDRYLPLTVNDSERENSAADELLDYALYNEFLSLQAYSLNQVAILGEGGLENLDIQKPATRYITNGWVEFYENINGSENYLFSKSYVAKFEDIKDDIDIIWVDGGKEKLEEKEIILPLSDIEHIMRWQNGVYDETIVATPESAVEYLKNNQNLILHFEQRIPTFKIIEEPGYHVVGVIDIDLETSPFMICDDELYSKFVDADDGIYSYAVGAMPQNKNEVKELLEYCRSESDVRYTMSNEVIYQLSMVEDYITTFADIFLYTGLGFAVFSAIMLANFISTSISYKKQEIGILRAIGSRGNDVFRIFFSESFIIAMINFILSSVLVLVITLIINNLIRSSTGILITFFGFGIRQIALLLFVSLAVAAIASFIPVKKIASKRPIDAIRNR